MSGDFATKWSRIFQQGWYFYDQKRPHFQKMQKTQYRNFHFIYTLIFVYVLIYVYILIFCLYIYTVYFLNFNILCIF